MAWKTLRNKLLNFGGTLTAKLDRRYLFFLGYLQELRRDPRLLGEKRIGTVPPNMIALIGWVMGKFMRDRHHEDAKQIAKVLELLECELDRQVYRAELAYLQCRQYDTELSQLLSPFSQAEFEQCRALMCQMAADGRIPLMHGDAKNMLEGYLGFSLTTTFAAQQYRYAPFVVVDDGDTFVDCGACYGDTAVWALMNGAKKVYSFEPSPENYAILDKNARSVGGEQIIPLPYGIGKSSGKSGINEAGGASHLVSGEKNDALISIVSIDDWCSQNKIVPDFIKMDIEGYELDALHGAAGMISKFKPKLAICLYHKPSHMWEIPLFIHGLCDEYSFWCRKNHTEYEFILYAAVKNRKPH